MASEFDLIRKVLVEWGMDNGGSPHSWRCEYPDRYPDECDCLDGITNDIIRALEKNGKF